MTEIIVKGNTTGLKVFINGAPQLNEIPKDEADNSAIALEAQISEFYKTKRKTELKGGTDCETEISNILP